MLIISDTNILSSLAAGDVLPLLFRLFPNKIIHIPPAVHQELLAGLARRTEPKSLPLDRVKAADAENHHWYIISKSEGDGYAGTTGTRTYSVQNPNPSPSR